MKKWIFRILSLLIVFSGAILCGFAPYLNVRNSKMFDFRPLAITLIVIGILCIIADSVEELIDNYKDNSNNKKNKGE